MLQPLPKQLNVFLKIINYLYKDYVDNAMMEQVP